MDLPATHDLLDLHRKIFRQDIRCSPYQTPVEAERGQYERGMDVKYNQNSYYSSMSHDMISQTSDKKEAHLLTILISSLSFSSPVCLSLSLASASRPLRMGSSKRFLNSWAVPAMEIRNKPTNKSIKGIFYPFSRDKKCFSVLYLLTEDPSVNKVDQAEVFQQVVLDGSP